MFPFQNISWCLDLSLFERGQNNFIKDTIPRGQRKRISQKAGCVVVAVCALGLGLGLGVIRRSTRQEAEVTKADSAATPPSVLEIRPWRKETLSPR